MKVNIFGVGRSGTKAVQLYISYLIAKQEGQVWINYEPYFLVNRHGGINYHGLKFHNRDAQLLAEDEKFPKDHENYIRSLTEKDTASVTKFIRGNGRIAQINNIMQPEHTILVVRDLYQVLASISLTNFNFCSVGTNYVSFSRTDVWQGLIKNTRKLDIIKDLDYKLKHINPKDDMHRNAIYWYIMNKQALRYKRAKVLNYDHLNEAATLAKDFVSPQIVDASAPIHSPIFNGRYMHDDQLLKQIGTRQGDRKMRALNQVSYLLSNMANTTLPTKHLQVGGLSELASINENISKLGKKAVIKLKATIHSNDLLDEMRNEIMSAVQVRTKPTINN